MKILLIDNHKNDLVVNRDVLTAHGHQVDAVTNAEEALSKSSSGHYDLVLTDINLPNDSGIRLIENLARQNRLFVLTEGISVARAIKAIKLNAIDVIFKPLDAAKIEQIEKSAPEKSKPKSKRSIPLTEKERS